MVVKRPIAVPWWSWTRARNAIWAIMTIPATAPSTRKPAGREVRERDTAHHQDGGDPDCEDLVEVEPGDGEDRDDRRDAHARDPEAEEVGRRTAELRVQGSDDAGDPDQDDGRVPDPAVRLHEGDEGREVPVGGGGCRRLPEEEARTARHECKKREEDNPGGRLSGRGGEEPGADEPDDEPGVEEGHEIAAHLLVVLPGIDHGQRRDNEHPGPDPLDEPGREGRHFSRGRCEEETARDREEEPGPHHPDPARTGPRGSRTAAC